MNIEIITYPLNGHDALWAAIRPPDQPKPPITPTDDSARSLLFDTIRRFLASCYARLKLAVDIQPLRTLVEDGIIIGLLQQLGEATIETLITHLRSFVLLTEEEGSEVVNRAISSLVRRGLCTQEQGMFRLTATVENTLESQLRFLVDGVIQRLTVREGVRDPERHVSLINKILEEMLLERGWDLGAHFAAAHSADTFDLMAVVDSTVERHAPDLSATRKQQIRRACYSLVRSPSEAEAAILEELGRLSFGIDLALERPRSALLWSTSLPSNLYLDASVVLPLIVPNHPKAEAYVQTLKKLIDAGERSGVRVRVTLARPFLNEITSHRKISREIVVRHGLENPNRLEKYLRFQMGAENVYVISYSAAKASDPDLSYAAFLQRVAPYETEAALEATLRAQGILVQGTDPPNEGERSIHNRLRTSLHRAYSEDEEWSFATKLGLLIDHEALQLWQLDYDARRRVRSVFVTADVRLRRLVSSGDLASFAALLLSPLSLLQLADLLVGVRAEARSLARVIWGVKALNERDTVYEHLMTRGLKEYFEEAYARGIPELVTIVSEEAKRAQERAMEEGVTFRPTSDRDITKSLSFLEILEDRFYEKMAREIQRYRERS